MIEIVSEHGYALCMTLNHIWSKYLKLVQWNKIVWIFFHLEYICWKVCNLFYFISSITDIYCDKMYFLDNFSNHNGCLIWINSCILLIVVWTVTLGRCRLCIYRYYCCTCRLRVDQKFILYLDCKLNSIYIQYTCMYIHVLYRIGLML